MRIVLIIDLNDTGSEAEALRQALEGFDYFVCVKHIGRPNDFIDILDGNVPIDPDFVIISCHGDNGKIHMSRLADFVYSDNEPRDDFSSAEVERYLKLSQKTIINLGCTTGEEKLAKAFSKNNVYIAPCDYIEGAAAFFHISRVWGRLLPNKIPRKTKLSILAKYDPAVESCSEKTYLHYISNITFYFKSRFVKTNKLKPV